MLPSRLSLGSSHLAWKGTQLSSIRGVPSPSGPYKTRSISPPDTMTVSVLHSLLRRIGCPQQPKMRSTSGSPSGKRTSWVCSKFLHSKITGSR